MGIDKDRYLVQDWRNPLVLFALGFQIPMLDFIGGLRFPRRLYTDQYSNKPFLERSFVFCEQCKTMHSSLLWSRENALGHWFGYVCPNCTAIIPCYWTFGTYVVLALTYPLWVLPARWLKPKWIQVELRRVRRMQEKGAQGWKAKDLPWLLMFASAMFASGMGMYFAGAPFPVPIFAAVIGGIVFTGGLRWYLGRKPKAPVTL